MVTQCNFICKQFLKSRKEGHISCNYQSAAHVKCSILQSVKQWRQRACHSHTVHGQSNQKINKINTVNRRVESAGFKTININK